MNGIEFYIKCSFSSSVSSVSVSVSSDEMSIRNGVDMLLSVLICGFPCRYFKTVSL